LAEHVKRTFTSDELAQLIERLRSHVALIMPMIGEQQHRTNIPCPLLRNSRCSVYSARPLACRLYHSLDVSSCKKSYDDPNDLVTCAPHAQKYGQAWMTMTGLANGAFAHHGYDQNGYELGSALLEALTNPTTWRRFQQREKAFPDAKLFHSA
jgi:Fe-S-cluster containining protein